MRKYFYSHIVNIESIMIELKAMDLSDTEIQELAQLAEETMHHVILDKMLSELSEEDKKIFLVHIAHDSHDEAWQHVLDRIEQVGDKIIATADEVKQALLEDIKELREAAD